MIRARNTNLVMTGKDLAIKRIQNEETQVEMTQVKSGLENVIYGLVFSCEMLKNELVLREDKYGVRRENLIQENTVMSKKLEKMKDVIGSIYIQKNELESDFFAKFEDFLEVVSLTETSRTRKIQESFG